MSTNPLNLRFPFSDQLSDEPEGVQAAHRYAFSGLLDLNQAIKSLKDQVDGKTVTTVSGNSGGQSSMANPGVSPGNTPAVAHEWINAYDSSVGMFSQTQPTVADVTGASPLASPTFTGTVTQPTPPVLTAATTGTTATAGAATLPTNPLGFLSISINGVTVKIPYYSV